MKTSAWPHRITARRLTLEPLRIEHADEMRSALADERLYEYIGGAPPTLYELRRRYTRQATGRSPGGTEGWLNWIIRHNESNTALGTVQATLSREEGEMSAELACIIGSPHQRHGFAKEAVGAMVAWLRREGVHALVAHIHPDHQASIAIARHLGLTPTHLAADGATRWVAEP